MTPGPVPGSTSLLAMAVLAATMAVALTAFAQQPKVLASGDAGAGQVIALRDCVACHERRFGHATSLYTRAERRVRTPEQLLAQVQRCNAELNAGYFPDEEEHVAAYLNLHYYKFAP